MNQPKRSVLVPPQVPMLARAVVKFPGIVGGRYVFEPKFDGYRALIFVTKSGCFVQSRRGTALAACFPEIAQAAVDQLPAGTVIDGELVVWSAGPGGGHLDFPALQRRIASPRRAAAFAAEQPASLMAFDLLASGGEDLRPRALSQRRRLLEDLAATWSPPLHLTPQTSDPTVAVRWFTDYSAVQVGVEGIMLKAAGEPYRQGKRGWQKLRIRHTAEAIVGAVTGPVHAPTRLILGLPGSEGSLFVAGATTPLTERQSAEIAALLHQAGRDHPWPSELPAVRLGTFAGEKVPVTLVAPALVVEVETDTSFEFGRWRHPTRFVRARPDLAVDEVTAPSH